MLQRIHLMPLLFYSAALASPITPSVQTLISAPLNAPIASYSPCPWFAASGFDWDGSPPNSVNTLPFSVNGGPNSTYLTYLQDDLVLQPFLLSDWSEWSEWPVWLVDPSIQLQQKAVTDRCGYHTSEVVDLSSFVDTACDTLFPKPGDSYWINGPAQRFWCHPEGRRMIEVEVEPEVKVRGQWTWFTNELCKGALRKGVQECAAREEADGPTRYVSAQAYGGVVMKLQTRAMDWDIYKFEIHGFGYVREGSREDYF